MDSQRRRTHVISEFGRLLQLIADLATQHTENKLKFSIQQQNDVMQSRSIGPIDLLSSSSYGNLTIRVFFLIFEII